MIPLYDTKDYGKHHPNGGETQKNILEATFREWLNEAPCLDENLPICKAQESIKPECTLVHEDLILLQQRGRWVSFHPSIR